MVFLIVEIIQAVMWLAMMFGFVIGLAILRVMISLTYRLVRFTLRKMPPLQTRPHVYRGEGQGRD